MEALACPECETSLRRDREQFSCAHCGRYWPVVNGIPHFVGDFPYWGEFPKEQMLEVNRRAEDGAWKAALTDSPHPVVQQASEMILNLERANWQWLLDLSSQSRVLDVGAGMGTNSHALALHYREVVALEPVLERVRFMQRRFAQERLSNIRIVRSSIWALPFEPASFDLAVMNGVLEWVPEGQPGDPGELQEKALKRICRLLRPGGYVYIGIENRMVIPYFIGYPDPHCGIPFTTILPRPLAHWYARRHGRSGYRNYLYSSQGYCKILRKAGFAQVEIYIAVPSYNHPRFLIPLKQNVFSHYSKQFNGAQARWFWKFAHTILLRARLLKNFQYSYVILARKPTGGLAGQDRTV